MYENSVGATTPLPLAADPMPLPMSVQSGSNGWQLDSKSKKSLRCLLVELP